MDSPAKIVATIGPACDKPGILRAMIDAGLSVARLNFSHGTREEHAQNYSLIRKIAKQANQHTAILQDLCGPKMRIGPVANGRVTLEPGERFTITTRKVAGDEHEVGTNYGQLPKRLMRGDRLLISDGLLELRVERVEGDDIRCVVVRGGELGSRKGITIPSGRIPLPALTRRDILDLRFGMTLGFDYVALSFVGSAKDIIKARRLIREVCAPDRLPPGIIAKIERPEALENLEAILREADGVMVARGDLGVEIPPEQVPMEQKRIIREASRANVPVITATQMLESMTHLPLPTRAEVSDVANAILDGTDAVMLSGETAMGRYPVEAVRMMARIIKAVSEGQGNHGGGCCGGECGSAARESDEDGLVVTLATCQAAIEAAFASDAVALCAFTQTAHTAQSLSKHQPPMPIYALSPSDEALKKCALFRGVTAFPARVVDRIDDIPREIERILLGKGLVSPGENVVIVFGAPLVAPGRTNMLKVHRIGSGDRAKEK